MERTDDYFDGLQVAYRAVFKLQEHATAAMEKHCYANALKAIDQQIEKACKPEEVKIILA